MESCAPSIPVDASENDTVSMEPNFVYEGVLVASAITNLQTVFSTPCTVIHSDGHASCAELSIDAARLRVLSEKVSLQERLLVPSLSMQQVGAVQLLVRSRGDGRLEEAELRLQFASPAERTTVAKVIRMLVVDVTRGLLTPLLAHAACRGAPDPQTVCTHVVHTELGETSLRFAARFMEVKVGALVAELRIYTSRTCSQVSAVIALTHCCTVLHDAGSNTIALMERDLHHLAFDSMTEAEVWAAFLRRLAAMSLPCRQASDFAALAARVGTPGTGGSDSGRPVVSPLLHRIKLSTTLGEAHPADSKSETQGSTMRGEGFDVAEVLAAQAECLDLPPESDTCCVNRTMMSSAVQVGREALSKSRDVQSLGLVLTGLFF